jgi:hypothetical protein
MIQRKLNLFKDKKRQTYHVALNDRVQAQYDA